MQKTVDGAKIIMKLKVFVKSDLEFIFFTIVCNKCLLHIQKYSTNYQL